MDTIIKFENYQTLPFFQIADQLTTIKNSENGFSVIIFFGIANVNRVRD